MADKQSKSVTVTAGQMFGWGLFALLGLVAIIGIGSAPQVSLGIYALLQFSMTLRWFEDSKSFDEGDLFALIIMTAIPALVVWGVSFIGMFLAVIVAAALLFYPMFWRNDSDS